MASSLFNSRVLCSKCQCHVKKNLSTMARVPSISFPARSKISQRYVKLEEVKKQVVNNALPPSALNSPTPVVPLASASVSNLPPYVHYIDNFQGEKWITTQNGLSVHITDQIPKRYHRPVISQEEIDCIMSGGARQ